MKKVVVQIQQQRFEFESHGPDGDALIEQTARDLTRRIELLRRQHGFPDSARAATLAALLIALEAKKSDNAPVADGMDALLSAMAAKLDATLERTSGFPREDVTQ